MNSQINYIIIQAAAAKFAMDGIIEIDPFLTHNSEDIDFPTIWEGILTTEGVETMNNAKQITYDFWSFYTIKEHFRAIHGPGCLYMLALEGKSFTGNLFEALQEGYRGGFPAFIQKIEHAVYITNWQKEILKEVFDYAKINDVNIQTISSNIEVDNGLIDRTANIDSRIKNFYETSTFLYLPGKPQPEISPVPLCLTAPGLNIVNQFIQGKTFGQISAVQLCLSGV